LQSHIVSGIKESLLVLVFIPLDKMKMEMMMYFKALAENLKVLQEVLLHQPGQSKKTVNRLKTCGLKQQY